MVGGILSSPDTSVCCFSSFPVASTSSASGPSASGALSSFVAGSGLLSAIFDRSLSPVGSSNLLFAVLGCLLSTVLDCFLSLIASGGPLSAVSNSSSLSLVLPASSWALFLTSTPSRARHFSLPSSPLSHSFLPFLPISLAHNPALLTRKRLFDQVFITQRPIASTQQQEELDLSFEQYSYSISVNINRL